MKKLFKVKILPLLLIAVLAFSFTACGGTNTPAPDNSGTTPPPTQGGGETTPPPRQEAPVQPITTGEQWHGVMMDTIRELFYIQGDTRFNKTNKNFQLTQTFTEEWSDGTTDFRRAEFSVDTNKLRHKFEGTYGLWDEYLEFISLFENNILNGSFLYEYYREEPYDAFYRSTDSYWADYFIDSVSLSSVEDIDFVEGIDLPIVLWHIRSRFEWFEFRGGKYFLKNQRLPQMQEYLGYSENYFTLKEMYYKVTDGKVSEYGAVLDYYYDGWNAVYSSKDTYVTTISYGTASITIPTNFINI